LKGFDAVRKLNYTLPVIAIDNKLVKSTAEMNKLNTSKIGDLFGFRTPNNVEPTPLKAPQITPTEQPDDWNEGIDRETPLEQLIQPKTDLLRSSKEIDSWLRKNFHLFARPMHYVGREANMDNPDNFDTADLRVLIVRLSPYDSVNGSLTHGALAQMTRQSARENGFNVYVDMTYMPGLSKDAEIMRENKIPYFFGRTSKKHPADFDIILFSFALTMECWNIIPSLVYSGIPPFKTMRSKDVKLNAEHKLPVIVFGGVVADFIESMYGKVAGEECVPDVTIVGDGEYTVPLLMKTFYEHKKAGKTKAEFLKAGHSLPQNDHFERDGTETKKFSWWYEPDSFEHKYELSEKTGYKELVAITKKPGFEHAASPGLIKRAVVRDLNKTTVWDEAPIQYDGSLGPSVDIQISSGCLCVAGDTVIETDMGFETIADAYKRLQDPDEVGGTLVQTRAAMQQAEKIVHSGKKKVRTFTFADENGENELSITCTDDHLFDVGLQGESEADWRKAGDLTIGQEVWAVDVVKYKKAREVAGRQNVAEQHYYAETMTLELKEISDYTEAETYDVVNVENHEYIANGLVTHNSGGLCSFCLAEGTNVTIRGQNATIESLDDFVFEGNADDREFDTPYGLQVPTGVVLTGERECITLTTSHGHKITCTPDHQLLTYRDGQIQLVEAKTLEAGKSVGIMIQGITMDKIAKDARARDFLYPAVLRPKAIKNKERLKTGTVSTKTKDSEGEDCYLGLREPTKDEITKEQKEWYRVLRKAHAYVDLITKVEPAGKKKVYDIWEIPKGHVFYANGFVVSNCHEAQTQGRWRERSLETIQNAVEKAIRKQGAEQASFYSLTWSLHSNVYSLLLWNYARFGNTNLISQRADQASADPNFFLFQQVFHS
jgi:hypothetical protein